MKTTLLGDELHIQVPIEKGKRSHSGKSQIVFTTKGFVAVEGTDLRISINVIKKI